MNLLLGVVAILRHDPGAYPDSPALTATSRRHRRFLGELRGYERRHLLVLSHHVGRWWCIVDLPACMAADLLVERTASVTKPAAAVLTDAVAPRALLVAV